MTIHSSHPFPTDDDLPRRLRGRSGGAVSLWTTGSGRERAGLTVTSFMVAGGEPSRLLALLDPDSDLAEALDVGSLGVVHLLSWSHRDLAEAFAGAAPAPGGPFRTGSFEDTASGPRLTDAGTWAEVRVESVTEVGWSALVTVVVENLEVGDDVSPLMHRRGRYSTLDAPSG